MFDTRTVPAFACVALLTASAIRAEEAVAEGSDAWLGRLVVLALEDGALVLDQEAWTRWSEAQPPKDDSPEGRRKRAAERMGLPPESVPDRLVEELAGRVEPPVATLFRSLMDAGGGQGGSGSSTSPTSAEYNADRPGFWGALRLDSATHSFSLGLVEEVGAKRHLRVEWSADTGLRLSLQGDGANILLACWPDRTTAIVATCGNRSCRWTGRGFEELVRSAPDEVRECLARPLAEIGIALPTVEGFAPPAEVRPRGLGATREEVEHASVEAAKRIDTSFVTMEGHSSAHHGVAFSPDGAMFLMGGSDGAVTLWDTGMWKEARRFEGAGKAAVFSPDGRRIAAWDEAGGVTMIDLDDGQVTVHADSRPMAAEFGSGGGVLLLGEAFEGVNRITVVEVASWRSLKTLSAPEDAGFMTDLAPSRDGKSIAAAFTGTSEGQILLWDFESGNLLRTLEGHRSGAYSVAFGKDGGEVYSGGRLGDLRRWDAGTGEVRLILESGSGSLQCLAVSPAGDLVARGDRDGRAVVRDTATGRQIAAFLGHRGRVESVAWSPDGSLLATGSQDGTVKVWRVPR